MEWTNVKRKLSELEPWTRNPRQINASQAKRLQESFDEFGQVETIAIGPDNEIYNGHQRLNVLIEKHSGDYEVECRQSGKALSEKEREKLTVFLHKGAAGSWDWDTLANEFDYDELIEWGFEEGDLIGWEKEEKEAPEPRIDEAEELREKWGVELGQLWQLGEHRVICGDCTDKAVVDRLMDGEKGDVVVSDPPYNVEYSSRGSNKDNWGDIENDSMNDEEFLSWLIVVGLSFDRVLKDGGAVYLCHRDTDRKSIPFIDIFDKCGWKRSCTIIWVKQAASMGWQDYRSQHECLSYGWKPGDRYFVDSRYETTVWDISRDAQLEYKHPTQKPVKLYDKAIANSTKRGEIALDFFIGSGTAVVACENLNRKCYGAEIEPKYIAVTIERWHEMTGEEPVPIDKLDTLKKDNG